MPYIWIWEIIMCFILLLWWAYQSTTRDTSTPEFAFWVQINKISPQTQTPIGSAQEDKLLVNSITSFGYVSFHVSPYRQRRESRKNYGEKVAEFADFEFGYFLVVFENALSCRQIVGWRFWNWKFKRCLLVDLG